MRSRPALVLLPILALASCAAAPSPAPATGPATAGSAPSAPGAALGARPELDYPPARIGDTVDAFHGTAVRDPYRWLEESDSAETRAWVSAQNELTERWLAAIPERAELRARLEQLWNYERRGPPIARGGRYFWTRNDGLQPQAILYWSDDLGGEARALLDPNSLSADGTVALSGWEPSEDAARIAWATSEGGSDWRTWRVRDVASGRDLADEVRWCKFAPAQWAADGGGFFYARYPEPEAGAELTSRNPSPSVYFHALGTEQSADRLVFAPPPGDVGLDLRRSEDGRTLVVRLWQGATRNHEIHLVDLAAPGWPSRPLVSGWDAEYDHVASRGDVHYVLTDRDAPRGRVVAIEADRPEREHWRDVVPESEHAIEGVTAAGGRLIVEFLVDAHSAVAAYELDGRRAFDLELPELGSASVSAARLGDREVFYSFTSFARPAEIWRLEPESGQAELWFRPEVPFERERFRTEQVFFASRDGTRVPMFLCARADVAPDGALPTYLYGYGGFDVSLTPSFSAAQIAWMERGGLVAIPNLRGGGEYGEAWHEAGTKTHKQNVFDDFIAAAEWLCANGWTRPDRLSIAGGSNGGLLVGACITQRPELFGAALPAVGVMDMLRYHRFTVGWAWESDYGSVDVPEEFRALFSYSPLHNLRPGTSYPPTLVTTGDHDDRVVPAHSYKFAAAMQAAQAGPAPALIRVETRGGHGAGKPTALQIDEAADRLAFLVEALGAR